MITVKATKPGDEFYKDATAYYTLTINKAEQIGFMLNDGEDIEKNYGDDAFGIFAEGGSVSGSLITFSCENGNVTRAIATGGVTVYGAGSTTITVTKAGNNLYKDAVSSITLTVNKLQLSITNTTVSDKVYGGANIADINEIGTLGGVINRDDVTVTSEAAFDDENAGENKNVTITHVLNGEQKNNYLSPASSTTTANITPLNIEITLVAGQSKIFGNTDLAFNFNTDKNLMGADSFTGTLSREQGEDIGVYAYSLGNLSAGDNYSLKLNSNSDKFEIKKEPSANVDTSVEVKGEETPAISAKNLDDMLTDDNLVDDEIEADENYEDNNDYNSDNNENDHILPNEISDENEDTDDIDKKIDDKAIREEEQDFDINSDMDKKSETDNDDKNPKTGDKVSLAVVMGIGSSLMAVLAFKIKSLRDLIK